jgi:hypothetical protein
VRTKQYAKVTALLAGTRSSAGTQVGSVAAWLLHAYNLPASTDISRLRRQFGELDCEVRQLRLELAASTTRAATSSASRWLSTATS